MCIRDRVKVQASADTVAMKDAAANQIQEWQKNGYETIAVICRDETEAKEVSDLLQDTPNLMSYTPVSYTHLVLLSAVQFTQI